MSGGFARFLLAAAEDATPPPSPPLPKPLTGLFHHALSGDVAYAAFDPAPAPTPAHLSHHGGKQLVPGPKFAAFFHEPVAALASTRGLVCLRGTVTNAYYVANPATFKGEQLPPPARDHRAKGEPQVVVAFEIDPRDSDPEPGDAMEYKPFYRHYHVVVAFPVGDGSYAFESFSSRAWKWAVGDDVAGAEAIEPGSGVGVLGCAFWRTSLGPLLFYDPVSRCSDLVPAPAEVMQCPYWELGEMEGTLCVTCMDDSVDAVLVLRLDCRTAYHTVPWTLVGHFDGGRLREQKDVKLLRSQGKAEVVMWDPSSETVVAMDIEGRTTRTIRLVPGSAYYADFIPYVWSLATISAIELYEEIVESDLELEGDIVQSDHDDPPQKVEPNAHKIVEHRRKYERLRKEMEEKRVERNRLHRCAGPLVVRNPSESSVPTTPYASTPPFQRGRKGRDYSFKRDVKMVSSSSQGYSPEKHTVQRTTRRTQNKLPMLELPATSTRSKWSAEDTVYFCTLFLEEKSDDSEKLSDHAYQNIQRKLSAKGATYTIKQLKQNVTDLEKKYKSRKDQNDPIEKLDQADLLVRMFGPDARVKNPTIASSTKADKMLSKETEDDEDHVEALFEGIRRVCTEIDEQEKLISSRVQMEQEIDIDCEKLEQLRLAYNQALAAAKDNPSNVQLLRGARQARMALTAALFPPD